MAQYNKLHFVDNVVITRTFSVFPVNKLSKTSPCPNLGVSTESFCSQPSARSWMYLVSLLFYDLPLTPQHNSYADRGLSKVKTIQNRF